MHILVVDESQKKALARSRQILSAFLFRKGSHTFSGRLSKEGVESLIENLKSVASKNTAVMVYSVSSKSDLSLLARIGRSDLWDEQGNYAFKSKSIANTSFKNSSPPMWYILRTVTRLAALFHDIGKANIQFQQKIRGQTNSPSERIRHELLSCLMFEEFCQQHASNNFLSVLSTHPEKLSLMSRDGEAVLSNNWKTTFSKTTPPDESLLSEEANKYAADLLCRIENETNDCKLIQHAISFLILTHHKAIDVEKSSKEFKSISRANPQLAQFNVKQPFDKHNLKLVSDNLPWHNADWLSSIKDNAQSLITHLKTNPFAMTSGDPQQDNSSQQASDSSFEQKRSYFCLHLAAMARPLLILSDYIASAQKEVAIDITQNNRVVSLTADCFKNSAFANTTIDRSTHQNTLADTLPVHLLKARKMIDPFFSIADKKSKHLPSIDPSSFNMLSESPNSLPQFKWQDDAISMLKTVPEIQSRPLFAAIVSETGAGKTLAGAKIMGAVSGESLRYTCALGLRSLTLQTGQSYRDQIGFKNDECTTLIGDALYIKAQEASKGETNDPNNFSLSDESTGSESLENYSDLIFDSEGVERHALRRALQVDAAIADSVFNAKTRQLIETPIVVCTIDHLMQASILQRGSDAQPLLRLMTADLIVDEIDNYSFEDLKALCRLMHIAGLYQRRVILMSATVSSTIIATLYEAWLEGLKASYFRLGDPDSDKKPVLFMSHNECSAQLEILNDYDKISEAQNHIDSYFKKVATHSQQKQASNKLSYLDLSATLNFTDTFEKIYQQAKGMSQAHNVKLSSSVNSSNVNSSLQNESIEKTVSIGVVRFNKVQQARQFSRFLHEKNITDSGFMLKVQCYHSHFPMLFLSNIESQLNQLLKRKSNIQEESTRLSSHPLLQDFINAKDKTHLMILVCSTSIQETGRDHDYDFAIVEPRSTRSLIQMSGRVLRHRKSLKPSTSNVCMLSQELAPIKSDSHIRLEINHIQSPFKHKDELQNFSSFVEKVELSTLWDSLYATVSDQKNKNSPTSIFRNLTISPKQPAISERNLWFGTSMCSGINASACLHANYSNVSTLSALEHLAQRFHFEFSLKNIIADKEIYAAKSLFLKDSNPYKYDDWLWGRHAYFIKFRRQSFSNRQFSFIPHHLDSKNNHYGLYEIVENQRKLRAGAVSFISETPSNLNNITQNSFSFTAIQTPERALITNHISELLDTKNHFTEQAKRYTQSAKDHCIQAKLPFPSQPNDMSNGLYYLSYSFSMPNYNTEVNKPIFFDVILGADTTNSNWLCSG